MPSTVADLLRRKPTAVVTVDEGATVFQAIELMDAHRIGCVVVVGDGSVVGIFTERDYLRRIALQGRTSRTTLVSEVMTRDVISVDPEATVDDCMALMTEQRIRHLPVMAASRLVGMLSIGDLVKHVSDEAQERANQLERLVKGSYPA